MRKSVAVLLLLVVCAAAVLCGAVVAVDGKTTEITVQEHTLWGEPAAADGLVLETYQNLDRQLFWHSTCLAGEKPSSETEFEFTMTARSTAAEERVDLSLSVGSGGFGISSSGGLQKDEVWELSDMMEPVWDVADRTGAGESKTEIVPLNRYYDTLQVYLEANGSYAVMNDSISQDWSAFLTNYFQIPVPDDLLWEVSVTKNQAGDIVKANCQEALQEDVVGINGYADCVMIGSDVYFLLQGNLDVSHIQGGYGIYRIRGEVVKEIDGTTLSRPQLQLKVKELENICQLDPSLVNHVRLEAGPQENTLLLLRQMDGQVRVRILDVQTGTARQELLYEAEILPEVWICDDLLILCTNRETIRVYAQQDGLYELWMEDTLYPMTDNSEYYEPLFAFDGSRLAVAAMKRSYRSVSSRVSVYEKSGLSYAGDYSYSSDQLPQDVSLSTYNWVEPLQIHWKQDSQ